MSLISLLLTKESSPLSRLKERLADSPIAYRLARGAFWSLIGGVVSRALTMITSIIIARLLGKEGYGEIGMVYSTMGVFGVVAGFGLGSTSTKYIAEFRTRDPEKAGRIFTLTTIVAIMSAGVMMVACLVMSPLLATKILSRSELAPLIGAGSLLFFISTIGGVQLAALSGFEAFRRISRVNIYQGIMAPIVAIPCVLFYGVHGAIAAFTINAAIGLVLSSTALKGELETYNVPHKYDVSVWREWPILLKFSFPAMLAGLMVVPANWITNVILVNQPGGYSEMGLFNAANQWRMAIIFLPAMLASAMLPVLSETHGREDKSDFIKTVSLNLRATWVIALPLTVMVVAFANTIASVFGKQFEGTGEILSFLMISCFLSVVGGTVGTALVGSGKLWTGAVMNLAWAIVLIVFSIILIPKFGGRGLAIAHLISYLCHTLWIMIYVEIKIAHSSIIKQWWLILFSMIILTFSINVASMLERHYLYSLLLTLVSTIPLTFFIKSWNQKPTKYK